MTEQADYSQWSSEKLIERVTHLEQQLREQIDKNTAQSKSKANSSPAQKRNRSGPKGQFDPSKYSTRFIALKLAYLGQRYNGFEFSPGNPTPLSTIEEELHRALTLTRLIYSSSKPSVNESTSIWEGCDYSKCGRTDKGVSAFGQVVGIRVRSNRALERRISGNAEEKEPGGSNLTTPFHHVYDEIPYAQVLNNVLPPDIRVLAWCPSPPASFSARFSCTERQYRYYFTQPAFSPTVGSHKSLPSGAMRSSREGWLDIQAMRSAARKFKGLHDFRNFCKVDASKQIENFSRKIFYADVQEVDPSQEGPVGYLDLPCFQESKSKDEIPASNGPILRSSSSFVAPKLYMFKVHGTAFLWHQVRHMAAILFLIGQGLESPSLIDTLLDVEHMPQKPMYEMANDAPLVLEDCIFAKKEDLAGLDSLEWVYVGDQEQRSNANAKSSKKKDDKYGFGGVVDELWKIWRSRKIDEVLAGTMLDVAVRGSKGSLYRDRNRGHETLTAVQTESQKVFQGGDGPRSAGKYIPILKRPRMETVSAINERYVKKKRLNSTVGSE
ncbi:MAG: hypothetical protein Q9214_002432 [Letrouitia sp. 1 TL-2023]